jgi:hypothetical protein
MSQNQVRNKYRVELNYAGGKIEHELAAGLFNHFVGSGLIVPRSRYRATVHPRYFAYIDHEINQLRFISKEDAKLLGGASVALRYFLLWLYGVQYDRAKQPIYSALYEQHNQVMASFR